MIRLMAGVVGCALFAVACDKNTPPAPTPQPTPGGEPITGNERLGWDQQAPTAAELAAYRYFVYVDERPAVELADVTCAATPGAAGFPCSGRLPWMTAGAHTLTLSAFVEDGARLESTRSAALSVVVVGQSAAAPPSSSFSETILTLDAVRLRVTVAAWPLDEPTDIGFASDGRIFIAERGGRVRVIRGGGIVAAPAAILPDVVAGGANGLLAIAVDPDYARTRWVYALYTAAYGFRLARLRAAGDALIEHVTLMDAIALPSSRPAATLRFGPDGKLYVGIDDGGDPRSAGDLGSYSGKVLRLNVDGSTPRDQAGGTPVYAVEVNEPRGIDWDLPDLKGGSRGGAAMWIVEPSRVQVIDAVAATERRGSAAVRYALPSGDNASAFAFYRGDLVPAFQGDILIAEDNGLGILRLKVDASDHRKVASTERLLRGAFERIGPLGVGRDGVIYFGTGDALMKIVPAP